MRRSESRMVVEYYYSIRKMRAILEKERRELEGEYNGLRGTSCGEMRGGGGNMHRTTEDMADKVDFLRVGVRMKEIDVKICVLNADSDKIRGCMDGLNGSYQKILDLRYRMGCSWAGVAGRMSTTERSAKRWAERALERIAEAMEDVPMIEELVGRATRARK